MSAAKIWKALDIVGQILCVWLPLQRDGGMDASEDEIFVMYFIIGAWQVVSFMVHRATKVKSEENIARGLYGATLIVIFICSVLIAILVFVTDGLLIVLYAMGMMFAGPIMAVFYFMICVVEFIYLLCEREQITDYETDDSK